MKFLATPLQMNDIIWTAIKRAQIPAAKNPSGLFRCDGRRPDGATLIPWATGKLMAWDVTVPDTFAESDLSSASVEQGAAAKQAADNKSDHEVSSAGDHAHFFPSRDRDSRLVRSSSHRAGARDRAKDASLKSNQIKSNHLFRQADTKKTLTK